MHSLRVLSLNTFGAPFLAHDISERFKLMAEVFTQECPDIICLQEVVLSQHLKILKKLLPEHPYCIYKRFLVGPKGGLVIFSKLPISSTAFTTFHKRGSLRNKSIVGQIMQFGILRVHLKDFPVTVLTTHLTPNMDGQWTRDNRFTKFQEAQLRQLIKTIHEEYDWKRKVILTGDFNIPPESYLYQNFINHSGLHDAFTTNRGITRHEEPSEGLEAQSIDYIFYSPHFGPHNTVSTDFLLERPVMRNGEELYLSNHIGLLAEIGIEGIKEKTITN